MPSVTLWLLDGSLVRENDLAFFVRQLGASEAQRYTRFKRRERQRQFVLGRMLLRFAISNIMALPLDALGVVERDSNAPQLVLPDAESAQPSFSLSHSGNWIACAVSSSVNLGVDIELNDSTRNVLERSHMAFHANECLWLLQRPEAARLLAFYQLWCAREALYKLMTSLDRELVLLPFVGMDSKLVLHGPGWYGYTSTHFGLTIAICSDRPLTAIRKMELTGLSRADRLASGREFLVHDDAINAWSGDAPRAAINND